MDANEYQALTEQTQLYSTAAREFIDVPAMQQLAWLELAYCTGKLNGEAGEAAEIVFKSFRGAQGHMSQDEVDALVKELGDVLWYVARISDLLGYNLNTIMERNIQKLMDRKARGVVHGYGDDR